MDDNNQAMIRFIKVIVTIILYIPLSFFAFFIFILSVFADEPVYIILVMVFYVFMLLAIPAALFKKAFPRITWKLTAYIFGSMFIIIAGREGVRAYHNSFETYDDRKVDLELYMPFAEGTLAVKPDTPSTLSLTEDLPRIDGATALYPLYSAFAQAVYPEKDYSVHYSEVSCNTTEEAYKRLIEGQADIIFVLHPSEEQLRYADALNVEMVLTPIGREAFVFFVNSRNRVTGLTSEQIKDIYSGRIKNWAELGGRNRKIKAYQRNVNSGSQTAFLKFMEGTEVMTAPRNQHVGAMQPIIDRTASYANYPYAIGYSFRFYTESMVGNKGIKLLAIDGVYPSTETIGNGTYPLAANFYAVNRADEENVNVARFINWILSPQGQYLVEKTGYNPLL